MTGKGHIRNRSVDINKETGMYGACSIESLPKKEKVNTKITKDVCSTCLSEVGKGISHKCSIITTKDNVIDFIETLLPQRQQEQITSNIINNKLSCTNTQNKEIELATMGKPE